VIPLSLLFVLASLGLLLWGLLATSQVLVWGSLGASIAAVLCLSVSVLQRRAQLPTAEVPPTGDLPALGVDLARPGAVPPVLPPAPPPRVSTEPPVGGTPTAVESPPVPPAPAGIGTRPPADGVAAGVQPPPRPPPPPGQPPPGTGTTTPNSGLGSSGLGSSGTASSGTASSGTASSGTASSGLGTTSGPERAGADAEPPAEDVPVGVALRAAQLDAEVLVVDGRPRYHLADCAFLAGRPTVPLPLSVARRSGFTPCALCRPDTTLLARSRR
jgi:hypothetical protein